MKLVLGGLLLAGSLLVAAAPLAAADCSFDYDEQYFGDYRLETYRSACDHSWSNGSNGHSALYAVLHTPDGERVEFHADNHRYQDAYDYGSYSSYNYNYNHGLGVMSNVGPQTVRADAMTWQYGYGSSDSQSGFTWCYGDGNVNVLAYPAAFASQRVAPVCSALVNLGMLPIVPYHTLGDF